MGEHGVAGTGGTEGSGETNLGTASSSLEEAFDRAMAKASELRALTVEKQADLNVAKVRPQQ